MALSAGERVSDAHDRSTEFKDSHHVETQRKDHCCHDLHKQRGLQLEAPSDLMAGGAHGEQDTGDNPERAQDAERVPEALYPRFTSLIVAKAGYGKHLQRQNGENARHEVQNQSTDECQTQYRRNGLSICFRRRSSADGYRSLHNISGAGGEHDDTLQRRRRGGKRFRRLEFKLEAVLCRAEFVLGCRLYLQALQREELRASLAMAGDDVE